jgi:hypothetical protein
MDQEQLRDHDLANYTDALLEGKSSTSSPPLASTVEALIEAASPQAPPEHLRRKIHQRVAGEWAQQQPSLGQRLSRLIRRPARRWAWAVVAAVALVVAGVALLIPSSSPALTGTAAGGVGAFVIPVMVAGALVAAWFVTRRKR